MRFWAVLLLCIGCATARSQRIPDAELLQLEPRIVSGRLPNGLTYFIVPNEHAKTITWGIDAGVLHENEAEAGVARVVAESIVLQTRMRDPNEQAVDVRTGADYTTARVYRVLNINSELTRIRDWIVTKPSAAFATAVVGEWRPSTTWSGADDEARWSGTSHPFRRAATTRPTLAGVESFHRRWYAPSRMTIVVEGRWNPADVVAAIEKRFSDIVDRPTPPEPTLTWGARSVAVSGYCCGATMMFVVESAPPRSKQVMRSAVVLRLFERALQNRLNALVGREASVDHSRLSRRHVSVEITFPAELSDVELVSRELARIRAQGFTAAEIERVRMDRDESQDQCRDEPAHAFGGFLPISCERQDALRNELIRQITDADVNALRAHVDLRNAAVRFETQGTPPTADAVMAAIARGAGTAP